MILLQNRLFHLQGEEIGMTNVDISGQDARLPVRTPFQWDSSPNAGFSVGT